MKIAIHQPRASYYIGGGERIPLEQAKYLDKLGHKITIITSDIKNKSSLFSDFKKNCPRVKIEAFEPSDKLKKIYKTDLGQNRRRCDQESLEFGRMTRKYYVENKFDVVAVHYTVDAVLIPDNQKVVLHLHGCPAKKRDIDSRSIKRADYLVAVSKYVGNFWKKMYGIRRPISLAYNGVNVRYFYPKAVNKKTDILYVGRLIKIKGVGDLIRAVAIARNRMPKLKVALIGKGPEKRNLVSLTKRLKITPNVVWMDSVSDKKLVDMYNNSRLCVFPSTAKEGVLTTMLEAAACGSAIITTDSCSMPEFIVHGKNGFLAAPNSPADISSAIVRLLADEHLRNSFGISAESSIRRNWTWEKRIKELVEIYKNV